MDIMGLYSRMDRLAIVWLLMPFKYNLCWPSSLPQTGAGKVFHHWTDCFLCHTMLTIFHTDSHYGRQTGSADTARNYSKFISTYFRLREQRSGSAVPGASILLGDLQRGDPRLAVKRPEDESGAQGKHGLRRLRQGPHLLRGQECVRFTQDSHFPPTEALTLDLFMFLQRLTTSCRLVRRTARWAPLWWTPPRRGRTRSSRWWSSAASRTTEETTSASASSISWTWREVSARVKWDYTSLFRV